MCEEQVSRAEWARRQLREICEVGDLPQPNRFEDHSDVGELLAFWDERKLVVVIELEDRAA